MDTKNLACTEDELDVLMHALSEYTRLLRQQVRITMDNVHAARLSGNKARLESQEAFHSIAVNRLDRVRKMYYGVIELRELG